MSGCCDARIYLSPGVPPPNHLLEVTIISAQDLPPSRRRMHTYATAWTDPDHKLRTRIDTTGQTNPTWNDKFVFRVEGSFLDSATAAVNIDIMKPGSRFFGGGECVIGTVRVLMSSVRPSCGSVKFVALQVRQPQTLFPQGIINVGVGLLDVSLTGMPNQPAFVLKDLRRTVHKGERMKTMDDEDEDEEDEYRGPSFVEWKQKGSADVGVKFIEREAEELESKLEKWRIEMTPDVSRRCKRWSWWPLCLFCGR